ncbi:glycosyltransferase [Methylobacterium sp. AMS5]|uniref:glycosyltransferase n=1 Tax=Methylobacterium sp. AMS5 TaxID=925818 RepID=UPI00074F9C55|nr:glycosyltransferase [Methylobacterium sp. AMS5]AMB44409.1 UDP-hexose transferase [Methylobacterium sp. AMS5]
MISVVIPVKNGARFIRSALDSVLGQGEVVAQVVVVDDGSTDETCAVVAGLVDRRIKLVVNAGKPGPSGGRNTGGACATGDWLYFVDADDLLRPNALTALLAAASAYPDAGVVYGDYGRINETGQPVGRRGALRALRSLRTVPNKPSGDVLREALAGNFMIVGAPIIRREVFQAVGGFNETIRYCEDWEAWCRIAAMARFHYVAGLVVLDYRMHDSSAMHRRVLTLADFRASLDAIFSDPGIARRVAGPELLQLRRRAEAHLLGYIATEALRMGRYATALDATGQAIVRAPRITPLTLARVGGALVGL